jgi:hypothetical protein
MLVMNALLLPAIWLLTVTGSQAEAQDDLLRRCEFNVVQQVGRPLVAGPPELVSRVRVLDQPGSPIAILMVDVSGTHITVEKDRSRHESKYVVDVQNVSDRPLSNVRVHVNIQVGNSGGGGAGGFPAQLLPGQTVRIAGSGGGSGQSSLMSRNPEIGIVVFVGEVEFDGCAYTPAQIRPIRRP